MTDALLKTNGKYVRIGDLLYVRNGRLYGMKRHEGKLVRRVAPIQGFDAVDGRNRPTAAAKKWVQVWASQLENEAYFAERNPESRVPCWRDLLAEYDRIAALEFSLNGSPRPETTYQVILTTKKVLRSLGIGLEARVSALSREKLELYIEMVIEGGMKPVTAFSQMSKVKSVVSRWALRYYERKGWSVVPPQFPIKRGAAKLAALYQRPPETLRERTLEWYRSLEESDPEAWVAATMLLQMGMRNGDAIRCRWSCFHREKDLVTVSYTPRKTSASSGRMVHVPISPELFERLRVHGGKDGPIVAGEVFERINSQMRELGWDAETYEKASYELRKMCIDRVYRTFGAEAAVQVSGDNIATVSRYYADPSRARSVAFDLV